MVESGADSRQSTGVDAPCPAGVDRAGRAMKVVRGAT
jgi:hypothetical protein